MSEETNVPVRRVALIPMGPDLLRRLLKLPEGMTVEAGFYDYACDTWYAKVTGPQCPVVPEAGSIEKFYPMLHGDGSVSISFERQERFTRMSGGVMPCDGTTITNGPTEEG